MTSALPHDERLARLRLLQLCSPALPIGAFAYSQGLEQAAELGWVHDRESLHAWLEGVLTRPFAHTDLPLLAAAVRLWGESKGDTHAAALRLCRRVHALRETRELRDEERHLGSSLARVLDRLQLAEASFFVGHPLASYVVMYGLAVARWHVPLQDALLGFSFAWVENQIAAASRLIRLGQLDAQELLSSLMQRLPELAARAPQLSDDEIGQTVPAFALASSWHEEQYSRLFRS